MGIDHKHVYAGRHERRCCASVARRPPPLRSAGAALVSCMRVPTRRHQVLNVIAAQSTALVGHQELLDFVDQMSSPAARLVPGDT